MSQEKSKKCRCQKCSCGAPDQAIYCAPFDRWLCRDCAVASEHDAIHILSKEVNDAAVYPTDFEATVLRLLKDNICVSAEEHLKHFQDLMIQEKDKKIAAILAQEKADKK